LIEKYEISIETRGGNDTRIKFFISTKKFINKTLCPTRGSPGALLVPSGTPDGARTSAPPREKEITAKFAKEGMQRGIKS